MSGGGNYIIGEVLAVCFLVQTLLYFSSDEFEMCGSFGGKGWHDGLQAPEEYTKNGVSGSKAYYAQELDCLEHISKNNQRCLMMGDSEGDLIHE